MFTYQMYVKEAEEWVKLNDWLRPFQDTETLDESLDSGEFKMGMCRCAEPFVPFSRFKIEVYQDDVLKDTIHRLILSDYVTMRRMLPGILYDHEIQTIELTKMLERDICDSMIVTNYLGHDYGNGEFEVEISHFYKESIADVKVKESYQKSPDLKGPVSKKNLPKRVQVPIWVVNAQIGTHLDSNYLPAKVYVINPQNEKFYFNNGYAYPREEFNKTTYPTLFYDLTEIGNYTFGIEYYFEMNIVYSCKTSIAVYVDIPSYTDWTITDVVERLLSAGITRRNNIELPKYVFDAEQAEEYRKIKAPEFFFTRSTMFEALMTVGGYIHAIPRLIDTNLPTGRLTVHFDKLGGNDKFPGTLSGLRYEDCVISADDYCGGLDSPAQNLLNTQDRTAGAVTDPDDGDYKTVRTEEGQVEIKEDTATIVTDMPIYQISKVLCSAVTDGVAHVVDITPYVYEAAEYDTLSSYWGAAFPYTKSLALRYSQGSNKITELGTKIIYSTSVGSKVSEIAIKNILKAKGIDISKINVVDLGFSITYIPIVNARVIAKKSLYKKERNDNYRIYNQAGNTVESEFYGTNMKGVLARIGNKVYRRTYAFINYDIIPKCGQILDGMYVAKVEKEFELKCITVTLTLTPNFNKLAEYLGLNSNARLYDISEKQSVDRYINYGETCLISHKKYVCGNPMITNKGIGSYAKMFGVSVDGLSTTPVYSAEIVTYKGREESLGERETEVAQTCSSYAMGNSMCFTAAMYDNFGAGYQASNDYENEPSKRANRLVRYCDALGNISYVGISLGSGLWRPTAESQTSGDGDANLYPEHFGTNYWIPAFDTANDRLFISKDSRERLIFTLQLHNQTDETNIVLGEMMTLRNLLINGYREEDTLSVYFLPHTINELDKTIDITGGWQASNFGVTYDGTSKRFEISALHNSNSQTAQSWVLLDGATNRLYIGENVTVEPNGDTQPLYFNFMDNAHLAACEME